MASYTELLRTEPPITTRPTHLLAAGQRLAFALGLLSIPGAVLPDDVDVVGLVCERIVGFGVVWARHLSHEQLVFGDGGVVCEQVGHNFPVACVPVRRDESGSFTLAVVVEALPPASGAYSAYFSFGVGRAIAKERSMFGVDDGTCGLQQNVRDEADRCAASRGFGRRADSASDRLASPIREGSLLALQLSGRSVTTGLRTARFLLDGVGCAEFQEVEEHDDGSAPANWVAGVRLSSGARVRILPADIEYALMSAPDD